MRTSTLAKMPLDYEQTNLQSMLLFLQTTTLQQNPWIFLLFTTVRPSAAPVGTGTTGTAMDGHAGQLRHAVAPLAGRPASTVLAPTLDEVTGAAELAEAVTTVSGHVRRWRGRIGHPRPPRSYWLAHEQPQLTPVMAVVMVEGTVSG